MSATSVPVAIQQTLTDGHKPISHSGMKHYLKCRGCECTFIAENPILRYCRWCNDVLERRELLRSTVARRKARRSIKQAVHSTIMSTDEIRIGCDRRQI